MPNALQFQETNPILFCAFLWLGFKRSLEIRN